MKNAARSVEAGWLENSAAPYDRQTAACLGTPLTHTLPAAQAAQVLGRVPQLAGWQAGDRAAYLTPGNLHSMERHEKLTPLQRPEAQSSIDPFPEHRAALQEAALGAGASGALAPCKPCTMTAGW